MAACSLKICSKKEFDAQYFNDIAYTMYLALAICCITTTMKATSLVLKGGFFKLDRTKDRADGMGIVQIT